MSLILDALRKSEAERRRGQAPDLFAPAPQPLPVAAPTASRAPWLPLAIAAGLAVAAVTAWRLVAVAPPASAVAPHVADAAMRTDDGGTVEPVSQRRPAVATPGSDTADQVPMPAIASSAPPSPRAELPPAAALPASGPTGAVSGAAGSGSGSPHVFTASTSPGATPPAPSRPRADPAPRGLPDPALVAAAAAAVATPVRPADISQAAPRPTTSTARSAPVATARQASPGSPGTLAPARTAALPVPPAPPVDDGTLRLSELPSAERSQLPPLKMSMHMWSPDASQRFVILDGSRVGQGDRVGEAVVEEITRDSAVLAWRGRRLQVPLR